MQIKYVGLKSDGESAFSSESGVPPWMAGDVRDIKDTAVAERMLRHPDVFALVDEVPFETKTDVPDASKRGEDKTDDGLDALDKAALLQLAKDKGLTIHHASGEDKIRAALRSEVK